MSRSGCVAVLALLLVMGTCAPSGERRAAAGRNVEEARWPVFRGDPSLSGVAEDAVPDSLSLLWSFDTGDMVIASPVIGSGRVFIGSVNGGIYALDLEDGRKAWEHMTQDDIEASPLLVDGTLYIGNLSGELVALDALAGTVRWTYTADNSIYGSANWVQVPGSESKRILVGSYDNSLHCLDAASGELLWRYETDNYINGAPATDGRVTVFGGCDELLHVVSVRDGTKQGEIWAGAYIPGSAALVDGRAYLGHYDNELVCIDIEEQRIVWKYRDAENGGPFFGSPAVGREHVVIGSRDEFMHCVDRQTGAPIWRFRTRHEIDGSPVIAGDKVVFGSIDGWLYVVSLEDGRRLWSYEIGAAILGCPAVTGGFVVIGAEDGRVYTFGEAK
jgi:outer membrane protein assembly factor BamB